MSRIWQSPSPPQPASSADRLRSLPPYPGSASVFDSQHAWQHMTVPDLFSVQAALTPLAPAIVFEDQTLSYVDLEESANQLAHYLRRQGLQPDQRVALFWEQGEALPLAIAAILGIWKAGGAYFTVSVGEDAVRQGFMMDQARPGLVLTTAALRSKVPLPSYLDSSHIFCLDEGATRAAIDQEAPSPPPLTSNQQALAYLIYTSGTSTGTPKGVLVTHEHLGELAASLIDLFDVKPGDRLSQILPLGFDAFLSELLPALLSGATLYPLPSRTGITRLMTFLQQHAITLAQIPPSLLPLVVETEFPALRVIATGGDRLAPEVTRAIVGQGKRVINCYGLTESIVCSVAGQVTGGEPFSYPWSFIGTPLPHAHVVILDDAGDPLPSGSVGQIALYPTALGYLDSSQDAERFIKLGLDGLRYCLSGDIGKVDPATQALIFWGRRDTDIIKTSGGELISLPAIETALRTFEPPQIADALALMRREAQHPGQLVAYVVLEPDVPVLDHAALRRHLSRVLPPYQVPVACVPVAALIRTDLGKTPRDSALYPEPGPQDMLTYESAHVPQTPTELKLAELVLQVTRDDAIPGTTNCSLTLQQLGVVSAQIPKFLQLVADAFPIRDLSAMTITQGTLQEIARAIEESMVNA